MSAENKTLWTARLLILASFTALMGATWFRHTDVGDAQLYRTITRHMLEDGSWIHLRYLRGAGTPFFDHLPFAFWPLAVTWRLFGESALVPLCALLSILTVLISGEIARKLAGEWAGVAAMFLLATTEKYFFQTSYPTLEPLLLPASSAAALVFLSGKRTLPWILGTAVLATVSVAIKGPFGLVPLFGVVVARAWVERSLRVLAVGGLIAGLAIVPTLLFLASHDDWWQGYVRAQLLASADGTRTDGRMYHLHAARVIVGRFWPWFPLTIPSLLLALGLPRKAALWIAPDESTRATFVRAARVLAIASVAMVVALCVPSRQIWHHTLVAYPLLCAFCSICLAPRLTIVMKSVVAQQRLLYSLGGIFVACLAADALGLERVLMNKPCVLGSELAAPLSKLPPGTTVLVTGEDFDILSCLAAERRLEPWLVPSLEAGSPDAEWALVPQASWNQRAEWREVASARGWTLATRTAAGRAASAQP